MAHVIRPDFGESRLDTLQRHAFMSHRAVEAGDHEHQGQPARLCTEPLSRVHGCAALRGRVVPRHPVAWGHAPPRCTL